MILVNANVRRVIQTLIVVVALLASSSSTAEVLSLPVAMDFVADAKSAAQSDVPVIVMVSLAGCPHCEVVRRSHLLPLLRDATEAPKPIIRQVEINGRERLRGFDGKEMTHAEFAQQHKARIAPVVFFFDAKGEFLTAPLVGSMIPDFYGAYFDAALSEATAKLRGAQPRSRPPL
jgi:thioredoxin-related protein